MKRLFAIFSCVGLWSLAALAHAQLTIDITTSGGRQIPVAVVPFGNEDTVQSVTPIISANLARSGLFKLIPTTGVSPPPTEPSEITFGDWTSRNAEALVIGSIRPAPGGQLDVRFRLFDVSRQVQLASFSYVVQASQLRATA